MRISQRGLDLIKQFEGYRDKRYLDSVGVPTIGYGTTAAVINPVPATCTREQAEAWLRTSIERSYAPPVNAMGVPLNQNQFDALVSFVYNLGPGSVGTSSTMGQRLRARDYKGASNAFGLYVNAGGKPLQGLINRRAAERKLFDTPAVAPPPPGPAPQPGGGAAPPFPGKIIRQPPTMRSPDVRRWQQRMKDRGWKIAVDGAYGPDSENTCRAFQKEKGLQVDGQVGPKTWAATWNAPIT